MDTTKRKVFVIVASIMFGLLCLATVSTLIDSITINFTPNSLTGSYHYMQLLTILDWVTFVFLTCTIAIIIINFFIKNKFKILEIILTSCLIVLLITCLILFPTQVPDYTTDKTFLITFFSSFMLMLFVTIIYLVSRLLLLYVFKEGNEEKSKKNINSKKIKKIMLPIVSVLFVIFTTTLIILSFVPLNKFDIKVIYSYTEYKDNPDYSTYTFFNLTNYSSCDLKYVEFELIFEDGTNKNYSISNLKKDATEKINAYHKYSDLENFKNFSVEILDYSFKAPRYDIIGCVMIPFILISGYFIGYLRVKKDEPLR